MGWTVYNLSGHRPGQRAIPHAWRWHDAHPPRLMVFVGGGGECNVEFNPLTCEGSANELLKRLAAKGINLDGWDLTTAEGRRAFCDAAATRLNAEPKVAEVEQESPAGSPATLAEITEGVEFPPIAFTQPTDQNNG